MLFCHTEPKHIPITNFKFTEIHVMPAQNNRMQRKRRVIHFGPSRHTYKEYSRVGMRHHSRLHHPLLECSRQGTL